MTASRIVPQKELGEIIDGSMGIRWFSDRFPSQPIATIALDFNHHSQWYDAYGGEHRDEAMYTFFSKLVVLRTRSTYNLEITGRYGPDKFMLVYAEDVTGLDTIANELKTSIDETTIPNPKNLLSHSNWKESGIDLDPTKLTVRVGIAYQQTSPRSISGLVDRAIIATHEAKTMPGQIVIVEYTP